jgi:hypothetical protein
VGDGQRRRGNLPFPVGVEEDREGGPMKEGDWVVYDNPRLPTHYGMVGKVLGCFYDTDIHGISEKWWSVKWIMWPNTLEYKPERSGEWGEYLKVIGEPIEPSPK